jgi:hypothetical protein
MLRCLCEDVFNQGKLQVTDEAIADRFVEHQTQTGVGPGGKGPELAG